MKFKTIFLVKSWFPKKFWIDQLPLWPSIMKTTHATARFLAIKMRRCFFSKSQAPMGDYRRCDGLSLILLWAQQRNYKKTDINEFQICFLVKVLDLQVACRDSECTKKRLVRVECGVCKYQICVWHKWSCRLQGQKCTKPTHTSWQILSVQVRLVQVNSSGTVYCRVELSLA
jgi:hypothetical protein